MLDAVSVIGTVAWSLALLAAGASLVVRFRRAVGIERLQLKWVAYGSGIASVTLVFASAMYTVPDVGPSGAAISAFAVLLIPLSAAFAILRYRLYDIDVVIERTLVYGATTAAIGASFFIGIVVLQSALRPITGGSELAVAASTLLCFALFQPIRRRVQTTVDQRFYRARYDATRTLDVFGSRLAGEVDLDTVGAELADAVGTTLRPAHVSLWLRDRS